MAIANNIIGQYETNLSAQAGTDRVATDKDTFLKLLVAQLTHQDPLNPVEDKEFIAQLAQFTQVEELQNINAGVEDLNSAYLQTQTTNAASLINTMVVAGGDNLQLTGAANFAGESDYPSIFYNLPSDSAGGTVTIWSTNADGSPKNQVYWADMPAASAGRHEIRWHGRDFNDNVMADGSYIVSVTAKSADGQDLYVTTLSRGMVIGVETATDGNHTLYLHDGRTVNFNSIDLIMGIYDSDSGSDGSGDDSGTDTGNTDG
ncbi:hypothetical protein LJC09_02120 [Desulfovibrio sp. OttesenSCG-928-F20]|nr:hypothetical protein [Desulfovibrio sp. OttesenSCG-928-M16]MDL2290887.1 hypothetical protein [Desulfovibrio sp. OttesenSCG-928-F20]